MKQTPLSFPLFLSVPQIEAKDVGKVFKIRIGHDNSGIGPGWFLESVDIKRLILAMVPKEKKKEDKKKKKKKRKDEEAEDEEGGEEMQEVVLTYHFPCSRWLARGEEDDEVVVELLPEDAEELEGTTTTTEGGAALTHRKHVEVSRNLPSSFLH